MICPCEKKGETSVVDSRPTEDGTAIRRRRLCTVCGERFTTFERIQIRELFVVKKNGRKSPFDRDKLMRSVDISVRKRNIDPDVIERMVTGIVRQLESYGENDIQSKLIGELVMNALAEIDNVAYIRYASVYRDFREAGDFGKFVEQEIKE